MLTHKELVAEIRNIVANYRPPSPTGFWERLFKNRIAGMVGGAETQIFLDILNDRNKSAQEKFSTVKWTVDMKLSGLSEQQLEALRKEGKLSIKISDFLAAEGYPRQDLTPPSRAPTP